MGVNIGKERQRIREAKEALRKTSSSYLRRDLQKFIDREERSIRQAMKYMRETEGAVTKASETTAASFD